MQNFEMRKRKENKEMKKWNMEMKKCYEFLGNIEKWRKDKEIKEGKGSWGKYEGKSNYETKEG